MNKGKAKCEKLKAIRREIAKANNIEYNPTECTFEGECSGTCPKCDAEAEQLNKILAQKEAAGEKVVFPEINIEEKDVISEQEKPVASEDPIVLGGESEKSNDELISSDEFLDDQDLELPDEELGGIVDPNENHFGSDDDFYSYNGGRPLMGDLFEMPDHGDVWDEDDEASCRDARTLMGDVVCNDDWLYDPNTGKFVPKRPSTLNGLVDDDDSDDKDKPKITPDDDDDWD